MDWSKHHADLALGRERHAVSAVNLTREDWRALNHTFQDYIVRNEVHESVLTDEQVSATRWRLLSSSLDPSSSVQRVDEADESPEDEDEDEEGEVLACDCLPGGCGAQDESCECVVLHASFYTTDSDPPTTAASTTCTTSPRGGDQWGATRRPLRLDLDSLPPRHAVRECTPLCACQRLAALSPRRHGAPPCQNRVVGDGLGCSLVVRPAPPKGLGLFAAQAFRKGAFVCEYAGELVSDLEARRRWRDYAAADGLGTTTKPAGNYILCVCEWRDEGDDDDDEGEERGDGDDRDGRVRARKRQSEDEGAPPDEATAQQRQLPPRPAGDVDAVRRCEGAQGQGQVRRSGRRLLMRTNIDPTRRGNAARFMNHSCEPNLVGVPVRCDAPWRLVPRGLLDPASPSRPTPGSGGDKVGQRLRAAPPRLGFFASRDIGEGEELCFDYAQAAGVATAHVDEFGQSVDDARSTGSTTARLSECHCGAARCRRFLYFDAQL